MQRFNLTILSLFMVLTSMGQERLPGWQQELTQVDRNAIRVRYYPKVNSSDSKKLPTLPDWLYEGRADKPIKFREIRVKIVTKEKRR